MNTQGSPTPAPQAPGPNFFRKTLRHKATGLGLQIYRNGLSDRARVILEMKNREKQT